MRIKNNTFHVGDNLPIMKGMDDSFVDLIYADPPFNSGRNYSAKDGSKAQGAAFNDVWTWGTQETDALDSLRTEYGALCGFIKTIRDIHGCSMASYLLFMTLRIIEMRRILKDTGTFYLHCDTSASHYLKIICDGIFGQLNFLNEIIWSYRRWPAKQQNFQRMHDTILRYSRGDTLIWNQQFEPLAYSTTKTRGTKRQLADFSSGRRVATQTNEESDGAPMRDVWELSLMSPTSKERTGYPTQKPLVLLDRIIDASSNPGDIILDPFAGSGTTLMSAQMLGRTWIGIDSQETAKDVFESRLRREGNQGSLLNE